MNVMCNGLHTLKYPNDSLKPSINFTMLHLTFITKSPVNIVLFLPRSSYILTRIQFTEKPTNLRYHTSTISRHSKEICMSKQLAKHSITFFDYHACLRINPWCLGPTVIHAKSRGLLQRYISQIGIVAADRIMAGA